MVHSKYTLAAIPSVNGSDTKTQEISSVNPAPYFEDFTVFRDPKSLMDKETPQQTEQRAIEFLQKPDWQQIDCSRSCEQHGQSYENWETDRMYTAFQQIFHDPNERAKNGGDAIYESAAKRMNTNRSPQSVRRRVDMLASYANTYRHEDCRAIKLVIANHKSLINNEVMVTEPTPVETLQFESDVEALTSLKNMVDDVEDSIGGNGKTNEDIYLVKTYVRFQTQTLVSEYKRLVSHYGYQPQKIYKKLLTECKILALMYGKDDVKSLTP